MYILHCIRRASAETLLKHSYLNQAQMPMASSGVGARYQPQSLTRCSPNTPQQCLSSTYSSLRSFVLTDMRYLSEINSNVRKNEESASVLMTYNEQSEVTNYSSSSSSKKEHWRMSPAELLAKDCCIFTSPVGKACLCHTSKSKEVSCPSTTSRNTLKSASLPSCTLLSQSKYLWKLKVYIASVVSQAGPEIAVASRPSIMTEWSTQMHCAMRACLHFCQACYNQRFKHQSVNLFIHVHLTFVTYNLCTN